MQPVNISIQFFSLMFLKKKKKTISISLIFSAAAWVKVLVLRNKKRAAKPISSLLSYFKELYKLAHNKVSANNLQEKNNKRI